MDKAVVGYVWFLSLMAFLFLGHTIGFMQGQDEAKKAQGYKFENVRQAFYDR